MRLIPISVLLLVAVIGVLTSCVSPFPISEAELEFKIPEQADWVDYGTIFEAGEEGEWDHLLWGGFTNTAIKKGDTYYLYYQGSREYLGAPYDTVAWRSIGVATSQDGINFKKHEENPVVTWFPSGFPDGYGEEGAVSGGVTLDGNGDLVMYFGANTAVDSTRVHADGRRATSEDGFDFIDAEVVLKHDDRSIWGSGDELFPIAAIHDNGQWVVYYLPNGRGIGRNLGVAWGISKDKLDNSTKVRSGLSTVSAWGTAGTAEVGPGIYAIFTNWVTDPRTEVRLTSLDSPNKLSEPVRTYRFEGVKQATVLLDEEAGNWYMYYRGENSYGVKVAPVERLSQSPTE